MIRNIYFPVFLISNIFICNTIQAETEANGSRDSDQLHSINFWDLAMEAIDRNNYEEAMHYLTNSYERNPSTEYACSLGKIAMDIREFAYAYRWLSRCLENEQISQAERQSIENRLLFMAHQFGTVIIRDREGRRTVNVDGENMSISPSNRIHLRPGNYRIGLNDPPGRESFKRVHIIGGQEIEISLKTDLIPVEATQNSTTQRPKIFFWSSFATTLCLSVAATLTGILSSQTTMDFDNENLRLSSIILTALSGVGLVLTVSLTPYVFSKRNRRRSTSQRNLLTGSALVLGTH